MQEPIGAGLRERPREKPFVREHDERQETLHHAGGGESRYHGLENARDQVDRTGSEPHGLLDRSGGRTFLEAAARKHRLVHLVDLIPHHDLILAVCPYHLEDARKRLDSSRIRPVLVHQLEANPGEAMRDALDIVETADVIQDRSS